VVLAVAAGTGGAWWLLIRESTGEQYLAALRAEGFGGQFASDAAAIAHGNKICTGLRGGDTPQGMPVDEVAVRFFCSDFKQGFHVLQKGERDWHARVVP
jgi:hypothetical protein